ncbi:hypothetical protein HY570_01680 [Candidatus Micrarchaeota archaeon]|nr:hypothetical protein [Candidatus Micrarchaeota archaeon]
MKLKLMLVFSFILILAQAAFQMTDLKIDLYVQKDGSVKATEKIELFLDSNGSISLYKGIMANNKLEDWRSITGIKEIRYHLHGNLVDVSNVQLQPRAPEPCNQIIGTCYATLFIKYDIPQKEDFSLIKVDKYKPRTTKYTLKSEAFAFESTEEGEMILPERTILNIYLPQNSIVTNVNPQPLNINDTNLPLKASSVSWAGRSKLSPFILTFETEQPLEEEVLEFFKEFELWFFNFIYSRNGIAAIITIAMFLLMLILIRRSGT